MDIVYCVAYKDSLLDLRANDLLINQPISLANLSN